MLPRLMPVLTLIDGQLFRTKKFKKPTYVGDPINAVKIFNEKMVDELVVFDIGPNKLIKSDSFVETMEDISSQAFMPVSYGGGISSMEEAAKVFDSGFEKVILNTALYSTPELITKIAEVYGSQSVVVSVDVRRSFFGGFHAYSGGGKNKQRSNYLSHVVLAEELGAGEIVIRDINCDGMMKGLNLEIIKEVSQAVSVPVVGTGGAWTIDHVKQAIAAGAHSVAAGNMFVYQGARKAVLINYPSQAEIKEYLYV